MNAYVVVSLLTGARTEELRALTWSRVNLDGNPPTIDLWGSVRAHGGTKTSASAIPRGGCGCLDATSQKCVARQATAASSKPDRVVELIAAHQQRKSIKELAQRNGVHRTRVAALLGRYNAR